MRKTARVREEELSEMALSGDLPADCCSLPADARSTGPGAGELGPSLCVLLRKLASPWLGQRCLP